MTDIITIGRALAVGAAETLELRDNIEGPITSEDEAKGLMKLFGQSA